MDWEDVDPYGFENLTNFKQYSAAQIPVFEPNDPDLDSGMEDLE
jgi:hypothetical protein